MICTYGKIGSTVCISSMRGDNSRKRVVWQAILVTPLLSIVV